MDRDVYMFNKVGLKNPYALSGTRSFNYLRTINVERAPLRRWEYTNQYTITEKSIDSQLIAVPLQPANVWKGRYDWFDYSVIKHIGINDQSISVTIRTSWLSDYDGYSDPAARIHIFETHNASTINNGWGVFIKNATDLTKITDKTKLGFIVWSYSGTVNNELTLPSNLPNKESQLVLAYWDHDSAVIEYDVINNKITTNGHSVNMDIIIIHSGFTPPLKLGDRGLFLFNDIGEPVLTNHYPPIKAPESIHIGQATSKVYDKPLIPLSRYGVFFTGRTGWNECWHGGLHMKDGRISVRQGSWHLHGSHKSESGNQFYSECDTIVLNRDDYFN